MVRSLDHLVSSKLVSRSLISRWCQVRSHFKVAFLNEFRKNARASLTSYVKAYELLLKDSEASAFHKLGSPQTLEVAPAYKDLGVTIVSW